MIDAYVLALAVVSRDESSDQWSLRLDLPWFRSMPLSCFEALEVFVEGVPVPTEALRIRVDGILLDFAELSRVSDRYWLAGERMWALVDGPAPVNGARVDAVATLRSPDAFGDPRTAPRRRVAGSATVDDLGDSPWTLGVTTFSFGGELRQGRSLRYCLEEIAAAGFDAVELIGAQAVERYPHPEPGWNDRLIRTLDQIGLKTLCYDAFVDPNRVGDRTADDASILGWAEDELERASALGAKLVRLNVPPKRSLFEALAGKAESRDITVLTELHAQTVHDQHVIEVLGLIDELSPSRLGLVLDLSCVMRDLPVGFVQLMLTAGVPDWVVDTVRARWRYGADLPAVERELAASAALRDDIVGAMLTRAYRLFRRSEPDWIPDVLPYTRIIHGKFFGVQDGREPSIPYDEIIEALIASNYTGAIVSEFEGHLWLDSPDTFGQLREHRRMITSLAGVHAAR